MNDEDTLLRCASSLLILLSADFMILRPSDVPDLLSMKIHYCLKCCCHWIKIFWRSAVFPAAFLRLLIAT